jgi:hypothetical protein
MPSEATTPVRVQLSRRKGWRMPENTVKVARPGPWGNPFRIASAIEVGYLSETDSREEQQQFVVACFRDWLSGDSRRTWWQGPESDERRASILAALPSLRGKNLACWCKPGTPCHADVLLELANPEFHHAE